MSEKTTTPALFRLNIEVGDLERAAAFYEELLGQPGRRQAGARCYFQAGAVTLQVVQTPEPVRLPKALYFSVGDLDGTHRRAAALGCLSAEAVHGAPAGSPVVRPWGERSFYCDDPWGNPLCFVEDGTIYAG
ncbi:putative enzyme related to lactoylglutathione lyase [Caulobacter ginsengisoli]|uniref:Enzyme related to lactoylglutathione lyase n=1 Tax=Caulobacter ginsengisoli TaxID=400775 RepID=A0ABU0IRS0_9CAUL|nr:VOC family protein [Caulobacter ginsengisoli]MDQ0464710.1 putative enzyme related to lactoylglutathione lyase [Caulobacter ginsengisoli]